MKSIFLYIACYSKESKKTEAFIAVTKAMLYDEVTVENENLGDHAVLFTSELSISEIHEKLKSNKVPYLLVDLGISYDLESVFAFLPESKIEIIKNLTKNKFSKNKKFLKKKMDDSVNEENFELAAPLRDIIK